MALRTSVGHVRDQAGSQRSQLADSASGYTADRATATSQRLEKEIQDLLDESAEIDKAAAAAAQTLHVGEIRNDQVRDQIVREIAASMKAPQAVNGIQPPESRAAAARQTLLRLQTKTGQLTGQAATFSEQTIDQLTSLGRQLGGSDATTTSSASHVPQSFNSNGSHAGGGGGGFGGFAGKPRPPVAIPPQPGTGVDINLPSGRTVKAPNETAAKAVRAALSQVGVPYV
ncbi:hypothetical protein [Amycolatopsis sp. NPDC051372]|uniref:hypothetical protein n=1 Tax=Amycolatopsis sp. NPDC051372 TaxID=3155669 RepID=UPI00344544CA